MDFIGVRITEAVEVTTGAIRRANLQSHRRHRPNFLQTWMGCLTSYKPFSFAANLDQDLDPETFNGIFTTVGWDNWKNFFLQSAALAEVCAFQVLLVYCTNIFGGNHIT